MDCWLEGSKGLAVVWLDWWLEPLGFAFMQRALLMALVVSVVCAIFSCFLVLKGWSLMGDAVSHAVLPGLVVSIMLGIPLVVGAFFAGLFCAVATGYLADNSRVKEDAVMGIVFSGMFALGLVLMTKVETDLDLMHVLFGNVLGLSSSQVMESALIGVTCIILMWIKRKDLMVYCFDPSHANTLGLPVRWLHFGLLILLALAIVSSLRAAGIILVIAMLIAPGATAFLLARSFDQMLVWAISLSVISCVFGVVASFHWDVATAPLIVVTQAVFFLLSMTFRIIRDAETAHEVKHND